MVGAGPGDPGLITLKGLQHLKAADVVLYDRLVDTSLLKQAPPDAELINVGALPGDKRRTQTETNALLVQHAREGRQVVRLKGGDPFVFGRGGEEADWLAQANVPFKVVPGVTSAIAAPAYAGIPLTHRDTTSSVIFVTGSTASDNRRDDVAWDKLAQIGGTLVVLMGWENLRNITTALLQGGRAPDTPAALVEWGTKSVQRTVVGTLLDIADKCQQSEFSPPIVVIIGEVVNLRSHIRWFDNQPLFGKRVLVTRPSGEAKDLSELLLQEGSLPIEIPTIEIQPPVDDSLFTAALIELSTCDWVVFASTNAVDSVFNKLSSMGHDSRAFGGVKVAAIGTTTTASLRERGISPDCVPQEFVSEAVVESLRQIGIQGAKILIPRSDVGRDALIEGLTALGASVTEVTTYRTSLPEESRDNLTKVLASGVDVTTFTSSSSVENFVKLIDGHVDSLASTTIACIGPITTNTAEELGLPVHVIAQEYTAAGLVNALRTYFKREALHNE